jgi:ferrous iron transport protein A
MIEFLSDLKAGDKALVRTIVGGSIALRQKFMALGLLPDCLVEIVRLAPMGDPLQIRLSSKIDFSLRKSEAAIVRVEKL